MQQHVSVARERFAFGDNWRKFVEDVDEQRIAAAETALASMLDLRDLAGCSFLDVGCGSGLFSLAALRLGAARVHAFDRDGDSVEAARELKRRFLPESDWLAEVGDVTDPGYTSSLGRFDVVYAWGVLHHTGAMWRALENTCGCVASDGQLFLAVYNDQGRTSRMWRRVKRLYNQLPAPARPLFAVAVMTPFELRSLAGSIARRRPTDYVRAWTQPRARGMSRWHDLLDWVGGYPFEVAKPEAVFGFCRDRGFELVGLTTCAGESGCNEFVFRRRSD